MLFHLSFVLTLAVLLQAGARGIINILLSIMSNHITQSVRIQRTPVCL